MRKWKRNIHYVGHNKQNKHNNQNKQFNTLKTMSEVKTSVITKVELKAEPWQSKLYFHKIHLQNGDKGEIGQCEEANPEWLKEGKSLTYTTKPGRFCPVFTRASQQSSSSTPQRSFYKESEEQWKTNKKSVILDSCLNRAKDMLIGKVQGYTVKNYREKAVEEYDFVINHIGLESGISQELEQQIRACETQNDLSAIQKDLSEVEMKNPKIIDLLNEQAKTIANKK